MRPKASRPKEVEALLFRLGFSMRSGKGSHRMYAHRDGRTVLVSFHPGPVPTGTLRQIVASMGLTVERFNELI